MMRDARLLASSVSHGYVRLMHRIASWLILASLLGVNIAAAQSTTITNWLNYGTTDSAGVVSVSTDTTISLVGSDKKGSTFWSVFDPIPLVADKPVTLSCKIKTPDDMPARSTAQFRIGIFGVIAGTAPDVTRQRDLRGFIINAGPWDKQWRIELNEHATESGPLIYSAGMTNRATAQIEATGGRGTEARVVITLTKKSADLISCSGFWADLPFSFEVKPLAGDYTHLRAVVVMRGGKSGEGEMMISNVKIHAD
jgi:hypothetical protein